MNLSAVIQTRMQESSLRWFDSHGTVISDSQIKAEYSELKNYLRNKKHVLIQLPKDHRFLLAILVCLELEIAYTPIQMNTPRFQVEQIQKQIQIDQILDDKTWSALSNGLSNFESLSQAAEGSALAYVMFTSGTTGSPKGIQISRKALTAFFSWLRDYDFVDESPRLLQVTEFSFDISLVDIGFFLFKNADIYFSDFAGNFFVLASEVEQHRISFISTTPYILGSLLSEEILFRSNFSSLRSLSICGARFSKSLYLKCQKIFSGKATLFNAYGPTECTVYSHIKKLQFDESTDLSRETVSVGQPLPGVQCVLAGSEDQEIFLSGEQLMNGYQGKIAAEGFDRIQDKIYFRTGDIAFQNKAGDYFVLGRNDDSLKHRGSRVNLSDIDAYIQSFDYIKDSVTLGVELASLDFILVSFILGNKNNLEAILKEDLRGILMPFQVPDRIILLSEFPITAHGKICRKTLLQKARDVVA